MQKLDLVKLYSTRRALIVDSYPDMRASIRRMLKVAGFEHIELATDAAEALGYCREVSFDLIICDYALGDGRNGQQLLEELRHDELLSPSAAYILVTAETTRSMVYGALEHKPDDYLTKPFTQAVLQARIDRIMLEKAYFDLVHVAMEQGEFERAATLAAELGEKTPAYRKSAQRLQGQALLRAREFSAALEIYQQQMASRRVEWACIGAAQSLMGLERWSKAREILEELVEHGSQNLDVFDALALTELVDGRPEVAQTLLERAVIASPQGIDRQSRLVQVALMNFDLVVAEKAARKTRKLAARSCKDTAEPDFAVLRCLVKKAQLEPEAAEECMDELKSELPLIRKRYAADEQVQLQASLFEVRLKIEQGMAEDARSLCQRLYKSYCSAEPMSAAAGLDMAATCISVGQRDQAQAVLAELAERFADDPAILACVDALADEPVRERARVNASQINRQGKALFESGAYPGAIEHFRSAVLRYSNNVAIRLNLVLAIYKELQERFDTELLEEGQQHLQSLAFVDERHEAYPRFQSLYKALQKLEAAA